MKYYFSNCNISFIIITRTVVIFVIAIVILVVVILLITVVIVVITAVIVVTVVIIVAIVVITLVIAVSIICIVFFTSNFSHYMLCWFAFASIAGIQAAVPVGQECVISVDASEAGYGNITCRIQSSTGGDVDIDIVPNPDGTHSLVYTPRAPGVYQINIKFGGQPVPDGEVMQEVGLF